MARTSILPPPVLGPCALTLITAVYPRHGNPLGQYLFVAPTGVPRVPPELFGIAWWILGAWLVKSLLDLVLRRTIFPDDNESCPTPVRGPRIRSDLRRGVRRDHGHRAQATDLRRARDLGRTGYRPRVSRCRIPCRTSFQVWP